jgi:membrane AbrB-like protein
VARWALLAGSIYVLSLAASLAGLENGPMFAGLLVGIAYALTPGAAVTAPRALLQGSLVVIGVSAGSLLQEVALGDLVTRWVPFLLFSVATIGMSVGFGLLLARVTALDAVTATFGMMGGGAQGMVAMSRELGADERLVATMQYLRVVIIVATVPLLADLVFDVTGEGAAGGGADGGAPLADLLFLAGSGAVGLLLARVAHLPTGSLLGPMIVAAAVSVAAGSPERAVPGVLQAVALAGLGVSVGLGFTRQSLRTAGQVLPAVVTAIVAMIAVCAVVGVLLAPVAGVGSVAGYLATSPGGLSVVVGISVTSGADGPFVVSVQVIRLFLMLLLAPALARALAPRIASRTAR